MRSASAIDTGPSARDIEAELRQRVDSLVPLLLSGARRDGAFWRAGSVSGEAGSSLGVNRTGPKAGIWTDWSAAEGTDERGGDMLQLICVVHFGGWSRGDEARGNAIAWARSWLGWDNLDPARLATVRRETAERSAASAKRAAEETANRFKRAVAMWSGAVPIAGTPAQTYLEGRGISLAKLGRVPGALRYLPDCWCQIRRSKHPAMIGCIMLGSELKAVHRTYLDVSQGKRGPVTVLKTVAVKDEPTRLWNGRTSGKVKSYKLTLGEYVGGCIPLWKGACQKTLFDIDPGTPVYVSEGIEDGLTIAQARPQARVVAGVALANMGRLQLPPQAGPLIFIGQHDPIDIAEPRAVEAFERAIASQQLLAREAHRPAPQIIWPDPRFKDFNDQLMGKEMIHRGGSNGLV